MWTRLPFACNTARHRPGRVSRNVAVSTGCIAAALALASPTVAQPVATIIFAQAGGARAELTFDEDKGSANALVIHTTRVGVAGSRLVLSIDHSPRDLFSRVLNDDECTFGENGSECTIAIAGNDPVYAAIAEAFRLGRLAHLTIEDAGLEKMSASSSLNGFTAAYGS